MVVFSYTAFDLRELEEQIKAVRGVGEKRAEEIMQILGHWLGVELLLLFPVTVLIAKAFTTKRRPQDRILLPVVVLFISYAPKR